VVDTCVMPITVAFDFRWRNISELVGVMFRD
jgi:hypothetical protein